MDKQSIGLEWVLASGNQGKIKEFQKLFDLLSIKIIPQSEFQVQEIEETGLSFVENAILKARNAAKQTNLPAIADDSGLEVSALKGEPGIYSARYSAPEYGAEASDSTNNQKLLSRMTGVSDRSARFVCALALVKHADDPTPVVSVAYWQGEILEAPSGNAGFGYDPLFYLPDRQCSAAELAAEEKAKMSHRGQALASFLKQINSML